MTTLALPTSDHLIERIQSALTWKDALQGYGNDILAVERYLESRKEKIDDTTLAYMQPGNVRNVNSTTSPMEIPTTETSF